MPLCFNEHIIMYIDLIIIIRGYVGETISYKIEWHYCFIIFFFQDFKYKFYQLIIVYNIYIFNINIEYTINIMCSIVGLFSYMFAVNSAALYIITYQNLCKI